MDYSNFLKPVMRAFGTSVLLLCSSAATGQVHDFSYDNYCIAFDLDALIADGSLRKPRNLGTRPPKFRMELGDYADSVMERIGSDGRVELRLRPGNITAAAFRQGERARAKQHCEYVDIGNDLSEVRASDDDECEIDRYAIKYWSDDHDPLYDVTSMKCVDSSSICDMTNIMPNDWYARIRFPPELRPHWKLILDDARQFLSENVGACEPES
ncbi:MAG: hypothetical protein ABJ327_21525 [Litoreibacter sp.]